MTTFSIGLAGNVTVINVFPNTSVSLFNACPSVLFMIYCPQSFLSFLSGRRLFLRPAATQQLPFFFILEFHLLNTSVQSLVTWISTFLSWYFMFLSELSKSISLLHYWLMFAFVCANYPLFFIIFI